MLTVAARVMQKFSIHPVPSPIWGALGAPGGAGYDAIEKPGRGLRDPRTPPERPCCNRALSPLASRVASTYTVRGLYIQVMLQQLR